MATMFENFDIWMDDTFKDDKPFFMVGSKRNKKALEK